MRKVARHVSTMAVILVLVVAGMVAYDRLDPWAIDAKRQRLCDHIWIEYRDLGLDAPKSLESYFSSVIGSPCRTFRGRVKKVEHPFHPTFMDRFGYTWRTGRQYAVCEIRCRVISRRFLLWPKQRTERIERRYLLPSKREKTLALLNAVTAGSGLWKSRVEVFVLGVNPAPIPPIAFDRPETRQQVSEYWKWLSRMAGPLDRFRDGWGHRIKLSVGTKASPILVASSAGPDGLWGTEDDIYVSRETKTGRIIGNAHRADSNSN